MNQDFYIYEMALKSSSPVILFDNEPEDALKFFWDNLTVKGNGFLPIEIIQSEKPFEGICKNIFNFAKNNFSEYVKDYKDIDCFVESCNSHIGIILDLLIEICLRLSQTLLIGVNLINDFYTKKTDKKFREFLRRVNKIKLKLKIIVVT